MNSHSGRPVYCERCGKWLGASTSAGGPDTPTHILCPDCLAKRADAPSSETATTRDTNPSPLVLIAGAATAATAGLLALILRELRNTR